MKFSVVGEYEIHVPASCGKGGDEPCEVQVVKDSCTIRQFRFSAGANGFEEAVVKAVKFCSEKQEKERVKA